MDNSSVGHVHTYSTCVICHVYHAMVWNVYVIRTYVGELVSVYIRKYVLTCMSVVDSHVCVPGVVNTVLELSMQRNIAGMGHIPLCHGLHNMLLCVVGCQWPFMLHSTPFPLCNQFSLLVPPISSSTKYLNVHPSQNPIHLLHPPCGCFHVLEQLDTDIIVVSKQQMHSHIHTLLYHYVSSL